MVGSHFDYIRLKFQIEKDLIEKNFQFIKVSYDDVCLICEGSFKPTANRYEYIIGYDGVHNPKVFVKKPCIPYNDKIHMYPDGSLCLHYPKDESWTPAHRLYNTIIPWVHEWFVFYELYKITGKWEHDFVPHRIIEK